MPLLAEMTPLPLDSSCRMAVLPFSNGTNYPLGDAIVGKAFSTQLSDLGENLVVQEGDVLKVYQQLRKFPHQALDLEQMQILGDRVDARLLITGDIIEMGEGFAKHNIVNPRLVIEMQIRDGSTGETLWTVFHRRQGSDYHKIMHFGTIYSMTDLARQMAVEIIKLMNERGIVQCDVLSSN